MSHYRALLGATLGAMALLGAGCASSDDAGSASAPPPTGRSIPTAPPIAPLPSGATAHRQSPDAQVPGLAAFRARALFPNNPVRQAVVVSDISSFTRGQHGQLVYQTLQQTLGAKGRLYISALQCLVSDRRTPRECATTNPRARVLVGSYFWTTRYTQPLNDILPAGDTLFVYAAGNRYDPAGAQHCAAAPPTANPPGAWCDRNQHVFAAAQANGKVLFVTGTQGNGDFQPSALACGQARAICIGGPYFVRNPATGRTGSGTSYATPVVAAAAAMTRAVWPHLTATQTRDLLLSCADASAGDPHIGAGRLHLGCLFDPVGLVRLPGGQSFAAAPVGAIAATAFALDPIAIRDSFGRDFSLTLTQHLADPAAAPLANPLAAIGTQNGGLVFSEHATHLAASWTTRLGPCALAPGIAAEHNAFAGAQGFGALRLENTIAPFAAGTCAASLGRALTARASVIASRPTMTTAGAGALAPKLEGRQIVYGAGLSWRPARGAQVSALARFSEGLKGRARIAGATRPLRPKKWSSANIVFDLTF